jgi:hypothetical protein
MALVRELLDALTQRLAARRRRRRGVEHARCVDCGELAEAVFPRGGRMVELCASCASELGSEPRSSTSAKHHRHARQPDAD